MRRKSLLINNAGRSSSSGSRSWLFAIARGARRYPAAIMNPVIGLRTSREPFSRGR
jgi:hypothetical protein